jgi:hypothetical protein
MFCRRSESNVDIGEGWMTTRLAKGKVLRELA